MSFKIKILDHNYCELIEYPQQLKNLLSYQEKNYNSWSKKFSYNHISLIDFETNTTYTGLVDLIVSRFPAEVIDERKFPIFELFEPELTKAPREYQIDYWLAAIKKRRMIIEAEMASGKTFLMAMIISGLKTCPALVIAPDKGLMAQLHSSLTELMPTVKIGLLGGGSKQIEHVTIGLPQTLAKLSNEELSKFKLLLVDEAHRCAASTYHDVILRMNAPFRFGFTGTPEGRTDNKDLVVEGLLGPPVKLIDRKQLENQGFIAKVRIDIHRGWFEGDHPSLYNLLIVNNNKRNNLICKIVRDHKRESIIILVKIKEHGRILQEMIGNEAYFVSGEDDAEEREKVRQGVINGSIRVLIATKMFGVGWDIPCLGVGIYAKGEKAEIDTKQGIGRVGREYEGLAKKWVDIYDEYNGILEEHSKERLQIYKDKEFPISYIGFTEAQEKRLKGEK